MKGDVYDFTLWNPPTAQQITAVEGIGGICYLSPDKTKNWTQDLLDSFLANGLYAGMVWESTEKRFYDGRKAGQLDAAEAIVQASKLGWPVARPIYFACDWDVPDPTAVAPYAYGITDVFGDRPRGVYGGQNVLQLLFNEGQIQYGWGTASTSYNHGIHEPRICLLQQLDSDVPNTDRNVVLRPDWGGWNGTTDDGMEMPADDRVIVLLTNISNKLDKLVADEEDFTRPAGFATMYLEMQHQTKLLQRISDGFFGNDSGATPGGNPSQSH